MITITELYRILFGRSALQNGNVIDMAEHGRAGGVNTGTPFKSVQDVPNALQLDEVDTSTTYIGEAAPGTATNSTGWRIMKIVENNNDLSITFPGGEDKFDQTWDNRASLTYS